MGNRESSAEEPSSCGSGSGKEFYLHCKDLYAQLRSSVDDSNGSLTFKVCLVLCHNFNWVLLHCIAIGVGVSTPPPPPPPRSGTLNC